MNDDDDDVSAYQNVLQGLLKLDCSRSLESVTGTLSFLNKKFSIHLVKLMMMVMMTMMVMMMMTIMMMMVMVTIIVMMVMMKSTTPILDGKKILFLKMWEQCWTWGEITR